MICSHCGAALPRRSRLRTIITGILFIAAAVVLLWFLHFPIFVLTAVLLAAAGAAMIRGNKRVRAVRCIRCGRLP